MSASLLSQVKCKKSHHLYIVTNNGAAFIKLFILPLIFLPLAVFFGFRNEGLIAILIMLGSPTTVSCYVMAKAMGSDHVLTSSIVVTATVLSSVSLTFWVYLLRMFSFI